MRKNIKLEMIYYLLYLFVGILGSESKSIEDPVARHDTNECGVYLCKSFPEYSASYMSEGCIGEFKDYLHEKIMEDNQQSELLYKTYLDDNRGVSIQTVIILSGITLMTTLIIGFFVGLYQDYIMGERKNKYVRVSLGDGGKIKMKSFNFVGDKMTTPKSFDFIGDKMTIM